MSKNKMTILAIVLLFITMGGAIMYTSSVDPKISATSVDLNQLSFQQERREAHELSRSSWNGWTPLSSSSIQMFFAVGTPCTKTEIEKITRSGTALKAVVKENKETRTCIAVVPHPLMADYVTVSGTEGIETVELYYPYSERTEILEKIDKSES